MPLYTLRDTAVNRLILLGRWPLASRRAQASLIAPYKNTASERLLDTALQAIDAARQVDLEALTARAQQQRRAAVEAPREQPPAPRQSLLDRSLSGAGVGRRRKQHSPPGNPIGWPGQHYRLLNALVALLQPRLVIEIGTATGMSALAMKLALPEDGRIVTFDVAPWQQYQGALLTAEDFADGRLEQRTDDLSTEAGWRKNADLLRGAEFILVDARHDGAQERGFLRGFDEIGLAAQPIVMFDDIRLWGMLSFWSEISRPKLDLTSFGHWSGTGLVDYA
jgi:predicted O-methyltransferase YrrM